MTDLRVPALSLVVLIGPTSSGKSTFARQHFKPSEIVSSDLCRAMVSDDEGDQSASAAAFEVLHTIVAKRLERGLLAVVDATNVTVEGRRALIDIARKHHVFAAAIVLELPEKVCLARHGARDDRPFGPHVVRAHHAAMRRSLRGLKDEGFRFIYRLRSEEEVAEARVVRDRLWVDRRDDHGPFDLVGDVHGCIDELRQLMTELGWRFGDDPARPTARHPDGRTLVFVGDLVDRGPDSPAVLELAMNMVEDGVALCVNGNHDARLLRKLNGRDVKLTHGLAATMEQLAGRDAAFHDRARRFLDGLISHYVLDDGKLVVAHAGLPEHLQGRTSGAVREFAMYGETTGEIDAYGLPVRLDWAASYRGKALVVHGHVPVPEAELYQNTIDVDTGCCFGGRLTAFRYPERELCAIPAAREYCPPVRPMEAPPAWKDRTGDAIRVQDLIGRRTVETRLAGRVIVEEAQSAAALEVLSRYGVDPRWLIYLPPTMSPPATSERPGLLEHPDEAFAYYREAGCPELVCEEKHMGSRCVLLVCRSEEDAARAFGVDGAVGAAWTRTGRKFFEDDATERAILDRLRAAATAAGLWEALDTGWILLDAELLPWSAKAQGLLRAQYAPVGAASTRALDAEVSALEAAVARGQPLADVLTRTRARADAARAYDAAWRRYVWPVSGPDDLVVAPFHLLASAGAAHVDKPHRWHLDLLARLAGPGVRATAHRFVDLGDPASVEAATAWWSELVAAGGEGMVVKPASFLVTREGRTIQPAVKVRGPEYLRIIYGPEYLLPGNLDRLRARGLSSKRALALRELALGVEALERFARGEPRWRVHEAVAAVLALETSPVDPRL